MKQQEIEKGETEKLERKSVSGTMLALLLVSMLYTALIVRPATAWSNGGYSDDPSNPAYGTHDWIAQHALDWLPTEEKQYILDNLAAYLYGTELPDNGGAPDGIGDTTKHHIHYNSAEVMTDDVAAVRASTEYSNTVSFLEDKDYAKAAKNAGIMSHYIVDMAVFGHVMGTGTDWGAEVHHSDYETYVNDRTSSYSAEFNSYLSFDGSLTTISAYDAAKNLAYDTTFDVDGDLTCVWMDQNYNWSDTVFKNRCGESLNLAVNYLADVLHTLFHPLLNVDPAQVKRWTPAFGKTFKVNVSISDVIGLYGYEFKLYWNTSLLDCVGVKATPPAKWGTNFFIAKNETDELLGRSWVAVALLPPASEFSGNTTLATLTFKSAYDPIYPENVTSVLDLADTYLSNENAEPISHTAMDGEYWLYSTKPTIKVEPSSYIAKKVETRNINVTVSDVVKLYNYEFKLAYNTSLLDAVNLSVGGFLKQPYNVYRFSIDEPAGIIMLGVACQAPATLANGTGVLATITFKTVAIVWPNQAQNTTLHLYDTSLKTNLDVIVSHDTVDGFYEYRPIPSDLNSDGVVNIIDLRLVARAYGTRPGDTYWDPKADLRRDEIINIFDLVLVAKNYGRTEP